MSRPNSESPLFDKAAFGQRVFASRKAMEAGAGEDISKEEMGRRVGVSGATYGRWEKGEDKPRLDELVSLAHALGVQPAWLAFGVGPREAATGSPARAAIPRITPEELRAPPGRAPGAKRRR